MAKKQGISRKEMETRALDEKLQKLYGPGTPAPAGKPFYDNFDDYAKDYPEGEQYRNWLTNRGNRKVVMFLMSRPDREGAPHGGMPGNYLALSISDLNPRNEILFSLHDCDDGLAQRAWKLEDRALAEKTLEEMKQLAPFTMWEAAEIFQLHWG